MLNQFLDQIHPNTVHNFNLERERGKKEERKREKIPDNSFMIVYAYA